jgi:hypothetical protein
VRTTITLDADTAQLIRKWMRERGVTFKEAVNDAIRAGASAPGVEPFRTETASLGESRVSLDRALQVASALEDDDLVRKQRAGS